MTKAVNLLPMRLPTDSKRLSLPSVGIAEAAIYNIFIERLWRSVKYEEVYLNDYDSVATAQRRLRDYFNFYNHSDFINRLTIEYPTRSISNNLRCFKLTGLFRFSILNPIHFCLKDGGKFKGVYYEMGWRRCRLYSRHSNLS